jgi:hypothetical protein
MTVETGTYHLPKRVLRRSWFRFARVFGEQAETMRRNPAVNHLVFQGRVQFSCILLAPKPHEPVGCGQIPARDV